MPKLAITLQRSALLVLPCLLVGCLGGPIAQQIASSMLMQAADHVTGKAIEAYDAQQVKLAQEANNIKLTDVPPDPYWSAFVTSGFTSVSPSVEALPDPASVVAPMQVVPQAASSRLVRVEIWNVLIGDEKLAALHKAQALGSIDLPNQEEWAQWQVATGSMADDQRKSLTFLIPPDFGKFASGQHALVEIASSGGVHLARYLSN